MSLADSPVVDAVFVIGTGSKNNNEELKYALRNLEKNCPFVRDVYISGECPSWVDTSVVKHLKWPDRFTHAKDANIVDKLRHACEQEGIAENILFCSDDQFQTHVCTWEDFAPRWLRRYTEKDTWYEDRKRIWHTRLRNTLERERKRRISNKLSTDTIYYYQPHIWMPINRDKFIEYAKWSDYEHRDDTIIASGYFNFIDAGGESNYDHVFISANQSWPVKETHVAYSDPSFLSAMSYLKKTLPEKSKFEVQDTGKKEISPLKSTETSDKQLLRTDDVIIRDIKNKIQGDPVWASLNEEIEEAEILRQEGFVGWKKVWNDIIHRWSETTEKGKLRVPVTLPKSDDAVNIVKIYKEKNPDYLKKFNVIKESAGEDKEEQGTATDKKRKCTKCEERKRKAREEQERRNREAAENVKKITETSKESMISAGEVIIDADTVPMSKFNLEENDSGACIDCAIEHMSIAIAYMNSNMARPSSIDIELARGEIIVASQHLLALNRNEEYNMCVEALNSMYSANSLFSVSTLRDILRRAIDGKSNP